LRLYLLQRPVCVVARDGGDAGGVNVQQIRGVLGSALFVAGYGGMIVGAVVAVFSKPSGNICMTIGALLIIVSIIVEPSD